MQRNMQIILNIITKESTAGHWTRWWFGNLFFTYGH